MPSIIDLTKPAESGYLVSSEHRANFTSLAETLGGVNLIRDSIPIIWAAGSSAVPTHYTSSGSPTITRETSVTFTWGMACKMVAGGAAGYVGQYIVDSAKYDGQLFDGQVFSLGCWVYASAASKARIYLTDGAATTYSSYHTGGSSWEWLSLSHTVNASATALSAWVEAAAGATIYWSGLTCLWGGVPPQHWIPSPCAYGAVVVPVASTVSTGTKMIYRPRRPSIVKDCHLDIVTAPTGQALIVDVNQDTNSMYSTRPQIAASGFNGDAQPDGTYAYRCFAGAHGTSPGATSKMVIAVDQVGSSVAGADLNIHVGVLQFTSPLEQLYAYND